MAGSARVAGGGRNGDAPEVGGLRRVISQLNEREPSVPFSDSHLAVAACRDLVDRFIYVHGVGWLEYDGKRWAEANEAAVLEALRVWTAGKLTEAIANGETHAAKAWLTRLEASKLKNVRTLLRGLPDIARRPEDLDANPDLLNVQNGVVHLQFGDLIPHNPRLYLTRIAGGEYEPTALHPDWTAVLQAVPVEVQPWLQVRYGQAITGHMTPDDRIVLQRGDGENGKSTVMEAVRAALGDYFHEADSRILIGSQNRGANPELADLRGRRFVVMEETPEAGQLNVVGLKQVAGTPVITARKLYSNPVSFPATHSLFVNTNYFPAVRETDNGTWRRLLMVAFPYRFVRGREPENAMERPGDGQLRARVGAANPDLRRAVLSWLVEGALAWYAAGRTFPEVPAAVQDATEEWREATDVVSQYWQECLVPDPGSYIWTGDLLWAFNEFTRDAAGAARLNALTLSRRFETHRVTRRHLVTKHKLRPENRAGLVQSRPPAPLDPHARLPGAPTGPVWVWVGVRFAELTLDGKPSLSWENKHGGT